MIQAHKFVEALGGGKGLDYLIPIRVPQSTIDGMRQEIQAAEKIEFVQLPAEKQGDAYALPMVTPAEREAWALRLLPLPARVCWFETQLTFPGARIGLLVRSDDTKWIITRFDLKDNMVSWTGLQCEISYASCTEANNWDIHTQVYGDADVIAAMRRKGMLSKEAESASGDVWLAIYMVLMLNSRTSETQIQLGPPKLNKKRAAAGKPPLYNHRIVRIVPQRFCSESDGKGGTHRSPRLHWRRTHLRHYPKSVPSAVWAPHATYNGVQGWWVTVIPRCFVGKKEDGEVSHEYRIEVGA